MNIIMKSDIIKLDITDYQKCSNIWDMQRQSELADKFYNELLTGNRTTYIYTVDNEFVGEISLVKEMNDSDYTIPNQRIYVSRLIVKYEYRRQGIGIRSKDGLSCRVAQLHPLKRIRQAVVGD